MRKLIVQCEDEDFDVSLLEQFGAQDVDTDATLCMELVFTDEEGIRSLNASTRGKDAVTDVLSFPNLENIFCKPIRKADFPFDTDEAVSYTHLTLPTT